MLAGARALPVLFASRHHFNINFTNLLDKSTQDKKNWLLDSKKKCKRQQAAADLHCYHGHLQTSQVDGHGQKILANN